MNQKPNRRSFLKTAALLPLGAAAGLTATHAGAQEPGKTRDGKPIKVSLNAYSFSKALTPAEPGGKPAMTLFDLLEFCAKVNFDAIDPTGYYFPGYPKVPSDSFIYEFKRRAFRLGIEISGTGVRNNFASPDKDKRAADV